MKLSRSQPTGAIRTQRSQGRLPPVSLAKNAANAAPARRRCGCCRGWACGSGRAGWAGSGRRGRAASPSARFPGLSATGFLRLRRGALLPGPAAAAIDRVLGLLAAFALARAPGPAGLLGARRACHRPSDPPDRFGGRSSPAGDMGYQYLRMPPPDPSAAVDPPRDDRRRPGRHQDAGRSRRLRAAHPLRGQGAIDRAERGAAGRGPRQGARRRRSRRAPTSLAAGLGIPGDDRPRPRAWRSRRSTWRSRTSRSGT